MKMSLIEANIPAKRAVEFPLHSNKKLCSNGDRLLKTGEKKESLDQHRRLLPIFAARKALLQELQKTSTAIVIGETGCGKTTQLPQYICRWGLHCGKQIACTQPRRVAAVTVATRVAEELGTEVGKTVGYCVRFDDTTSAQTKLKYMTDGMLLREAMLDPLLKSYSVVVLDEAHERTIHTDVLFGVVKAAQKQRLASGRPALKVVIMSATMDVDQFSSYFNNCPVLYLEGRQHHVKLLYAPEPQSDYVFSCLVSVFQIHRDAPAGEDILVFLTGQEEVEATVKSIRDIAKDLSSDLPPLLVCPMYAALPASQQLSPFQPTPAGSRKIIVATNIAETSVTIRGIKHIVDSGKVKAKCFQPETGMDLLKVQCVSQAQAWQRTGRAGREAPGTCYRLYTEQDFKSYAVNTVPEILRCNLSSVILQLMAIGITDISSFDFMDKPEAAAVNKALEQLEMLSAVNGKKLTTLGRKMAAFPLDPPFSKALLMAAENGCLEEMLTIVSVLSVDRVVHAPQSKHDDALASKQKFLSSEGDHIMYLNMYRGFKSVNGNRKWCHENFINAGNMKAASDVRSQLRELCLNQELPLKTCGRDTTPIRKCLATVFYTSSAQLQPDRKYLTLSSRQPVAIHPSSALFMCKPGFVIFTSLTKTTKCYMRDICVVDPDWLYEASPAFFKHKKPGTLHFASSK